MKNHSINKYLNKNIDKAVKTKKQLDILQKREQMNQKSNKNNYSTLIDIKAQQKADEAVDRVTRDLEFEFEQTNTVVQDTKKSLQNHPKKDCKQSNEKNISRESSQDKFKTVTYLKTQLSSNSNFDSSSNNLKQTSQKNSKFNQKIVSEKNKSIISTVSASAKPAGPVDGNATDNSFNKHAQETNDFPKEFIDTKTFMNNLQNFTSINKDLINITDKIKNHVKVNLPKIDLNKTQNSFYENLQTCIDNKDVSKINADLDLHDKLRQSPYQNIKERFKDKDKKLGKMTRKEECDFRVSSPFRSYKKRVGFSIGKLFEFLKTNHLETVAHYQDLVYQGTYHDPEKRDTKSVARLMQSNSIRIQTEIAEAQYNNLIQRYNDMQKQNPVKLLFDGIMHKRMADIQNKDVLKKISNLIMDKVNQFEGVQKFCSTLESFDIPEINQTLACKDRNIVPIFDFIKHHKKQLILDFGSKVNNADQLQVYAQYMKPIDEHKYNFFDLGKIIHIDHTDFTQYTPLSIIGLISANCERLKLNDSIFNFEALEKISLKIHHFEQLRQIDLSRCYLSDNLGGTCFQHLINRNTVQLNLKYNHFSKLMVRQFNELNRKNACQLKILLLDHNSVSFDDFCELLSNLCTNRHLQFLSLENCYLASNQRDMAINQVRLNKFRTNDTYLLHLDISNNKMNENFCNRVYECLGGKDSQLAVHSKGNKVIFDKVARFNPTFCHDFQEEMNREFDTCWICEDSSYLRFKLAQQDFQAVNDESTFINIPLQVHFEFQNYMPIQMYMKGKFIETSFQVPNFRFKFFFSYNVIKCIPQLLKDFEVVEQPLTNNPQLHKMRMLPVRKMNLQVPDRPAKRTPKDQVRIIKDPPEFDNQRVDQKLDDSEEKKEDEVELYVLENIKMFYEEEVPAKSDRSVFDERTRKLYIKQDSHFEFDLERGKWKDLVKKEVKFTLKEYRALINQVRVNYRLLVLLHQRMALKCSKGTSIYFKVTKSTVFDFFKNILGLIDEVVQTSADQAADQNQVNTIETTGNRTRMAEAIANNDNVVTRQELFDLLQRWTLRINVPKNAPETQYMFNFLFKKLEPLIQDPLDLRQMIMCDNGIYRIVNIFKYLIQYTQENQKRKAKNTMNLKRVMKCLNEIFGKDTMLQYEQQTFVQGILVDDILGYVAEVNFNKFVEIVIRSIIAKKIKASDLDRESLKLLQEMSFKDLDEVNINKMPMYQRLCLTLPNMFKVLTKDQMEVFLRKFDNSFLENSQLDGFIDENYFTKIDDRMKMVTYIKRNIQVQIVRSLKNSDEYIQVIEEFRKYKDNAIINFEKSKINQFNKPINMAKPTLSKESLNSLGKTSVISKKSNEVADVIEEQDEGSDSNNSSSLDLNSVEKGDQNEYFNQQETVQFSAISKSHSKSLSVLDEDEMKEALSKHRSSIISNNSEMSKLRRKRNEYIQSETKHDVHLNVDYRNSNYVNKSNMKGSIKGSMKGSFKGSMKGSFKGSMKGSFKGSMKGSPISSMKENALGSIKDSNLGSVKAETEKLSSLTSVEDSNSQLESIPDETIEKLPSGLDLGDIEVDIVEDDIKTVDDEDV